MRLAAVIINPRRYSPLEPNKRIQRRIKTIAGRLRRRGAISDAEYRTTLGLPAEAPAPAIDSTLFTPADLPATPHEPEPDTVPVPEPVTEPVPTEPDSGSGGAPATRTAA